MPRMTEAERRALGEVVMRLRDIEGQTFDAIAQRVGLVSRQAARLLYKQEYQRRVDARAIDAMERGQAPDPWATMSTKTLNRFRRHRPDLLAEYLRTQQAMTAQRRTAVNGVDNEQTEASTWTEPF